MSIGTVGYSIYVGSLWAHQVHGIRIFLVVAGGFLGISRTNGEEHPLIK
jgi:hypothetical protein